MKTFFERVRGNPDINNQKSPLDLSVIPNHMGINLCAVDHVVWQEQDDGQLVSLSIYFHPEEKE